MNTYLYSLASARIVATILPHKRYTLTKLHEAGAQLFASFTQQLTNIEESDTHILHKAEAAIQICVDYLRQLKTLALQYKFTDQGEEIRFFKHIKPPFLSPLIYYKAVFNIYSQWPEGSEIIQRGYLKRELFKLKQFFTDYLHFYSYHRTHSTHLDDKYFVRGDFDIRIIPDAFCFEADTTFSTGYDYILARIEANKRLLIYLEKLLMNGETRASLSPITYGKAPSLTWTGSKADAVELIYALHSIGIFNNGQADVKAIATWFEQTFHIKLGNYYDYFQDIKMRKTEPTKLLNKMTITLQKKIKEKD